MLRLDVNVPDSDAEGYDIPAGNPFVGAGRRRAAGDLGVRPAQPLALQLRRSRARRDRRADHRRRRSGRWEEIDYEPAGRGGRNYGWRNREGAHDQRQRTCRPPICRSIDPIHEYGRAIGQSITGGYVYRAARSAPRIVGRYFFADFIRGRVWSLALTVDPATGEAIASGLIEHTAELRLAGPASARSASMRRASCTS